MSEQREPQSAETKDKDQQIAEAIRTLTALLRTVLERLDDVVQLLTLSPGEGPTLDELLAKIVALISDQGTLLKHTNDGVRLLVQQLLQPGSVGPAAEGTPGHGPSVRT